MSPCASPPRLLTAFALALALPLAAAAQGLERGRLLYETHCSGCHYERIHDRKASTVRNLAELRKVVRQRAPQTGRVFSADELRDIVDYLNAAHYRF